MGNIFTKRAEDHPSKETSSVIDSNKIDTIVGPNSTIKGDLHSKGTLRIDGTVEGKVCSESTIILGEKGIAKATLEAQQVIIGGTVHGNVEASDRLEILSTGKVYGDICTASARFIVAEGVVFEGRVTMGAKKGAQGQGGNAAPGKKVAEPSKPEQSKEEAGQPVAASK